MNNREHFGNLFHGLDFLLPELSDTEFHESLKRLHEMGDRLSDRMQSETERMKREKEPEAPEDEYLDRIGYDG